VHDLLIALSESTTMPDTEFVVNLHDYNKAIVPGGSKTECADRAFDVSELEQGIKGRRTGNQEILTTNGYSNSPLPIFSAVSCCYSYDLSFPTTYYDFDGIDDEWEALKNSSSQISWYNKTARALFRGSIFFYQDHARTRAYLLSALRPDELDVDWYEELRTELLDQDGRSVFGDIASHARFKYLLNLEGHDFWSGRMRSLVHLRSVLFKQQLPCDEFWYSLLQPHVHYVPIRRDLRDLPEQVQHARKNDPAMHTMSDDLLARATPLLRKKAVLAYVRLLLMRYTQLLRFRVERSPHAQPVTKLPNIAPQPHHHATVSRKKGSGGLLVSPTRIRKHAATLLLTQQSEADAVGDIHTAALCRIATQTLQQHHTLTSDRTGQPAGATASDPAVGTNRKSLRDEIGTVLKASPLPPLPAGSLHLELASTSLDFNKYARQHSSLPGELVVHTKYGLGNRLLTLVSAFVLAVLSKRKLLVDWSEHASSLSDLLEEPAGMQWELPKDYPTYQTPHLELLLHSPSLQNAAAALACQNLSETWQGIPTVHIVSDQYFLPLLILNKHFKLQLRELLGTSAESPEADLFGIAARWLLRPAPGVRHLVHSLQDDPTIPPPMLIYSTLWP